MFAAVILAFVLPILFISILCSNDKVKSVIFSIFPMITGLNYRTKTVSNFSLSKFNINSKLVFALIKCLLLRHVVAVANGHIQAGLEGSVIASHVHSIGFVADAKFVSHM